MGNLLQRLLSHANQGAPQAAWQGKKNDRKGNLRVWLADLEDPWSQARIDLPDVETVGGKTEGVGGKIAEGEGERLLKCERRRILQTQDSGVHSPS